MRDRLVWQSASLLLAYPDDGLAERLHMVDALRARKRARRRRCWGER